MNHPKNFLEYALAVAADGGIQKVYTDSVIGAVSGVSRGALLLGLVDDGPDGEALTRSGVEVFVTAGERNAVLTPAGEVDRAVLEDPIVYKSGAYFQFKAQLYHVGLLTRVALTSWQRSLLTSGDSTTQLDNGLSGRVTPNQGSCQPV